MISKFENSPEVSQVINSAFLIAKQLNNKYITCEHFLMALIVNPKLSNALINMGVDVPTLQHELELTLQDNPQYNQLVDVNDTPSFTGECQSMFAYAAQLAMNSNRKTMSILDFLEALETKSESYSGYYIAKFNIDITRLKTMKEFTEDTSGSKKEQALETMYNFCRNLNEAAKDGKLDPVIGRAAEIKKISQTLARKNKPNVILVGDSGTGKTAIAEGLAYKIVNKETPIYLQDKTIWSLDMGELLAGCRYRGDFEERVTQILNAAEVVGNCYIFVDEAHQLTGAGTATHGGVDFKNMVKPALAKGRVKIIANTTWEEYRKEFEKDRAFTRRFKVIPIDEPTMADSIAILEGLKPGLEKFHSVMITQAAIQAAVELSTRYQKDKKLPDKAIDLIDGAAARLKLELPVIDPQNVENININTATVDREDIITELEMSVSVKIPRSNEAEENYTSIVSRIKEKVFGQDHVIDVVERKIKLGKAGLKRRNKPVANLMFIGPTGTGKTFLAQTLAEVLHMPLLRYDMSEYMEKHSVAKFIGAPPGYVGYGDGGAGNGLLINDISQNPTAILFFDEIDKAHPDISDLLLQLLDEGRATSNSGKTVDACNSIIILSNNLGAAAETKNPLGYSGLKTGKTKQTVEIERFFRPEFRNRLDDICTFKALDDISLRKTVMAQINELNLLLADRQIKVFPMEAVIDQVLAANSEQNMGARPIGRLVERIIAEPLSTYILDSKPKPNTTLTLDWSDKLEITAKILEQTSENITA
jgi:ATP-dependent Clp protease ATP-binding subunit ClpA